MAVFGNVFAEYRDSYEKDYIRAANSRSVSTKSGKSNKSSTLYVKSKIDYQSDKNRFISESSEPSIPVKACYDTRGRLIEVSIERCPFDIDRIVIQAFGECLPFHSTLSKFTIRSEVTAALLHEIGKLLPNSNLTDICLDGAVVPEGNYDILLERASPLKTLSLNRCGIGDSTCEKLAVNMDFRKPGCTLLTLDLGSNHISDIGALGLADMFRRNRQLLHLNLSGNMITDKGAASILNHLMEFPLTCDEILEMKSSRMKFNRQKIALYEQCLREAAYENRNMAQPATNLTYKLVKSLTSFKPKGMKRSKKKRSVTLTPNTLTVPAVKEICSTEDLASNMTKEIMADFSHPFSSKYAFKKHGYYFCAGNMVLCSLNLAYNNLAYQSVEKIHQVLQYQQRQQPLKNNSSPKGLLRIVIDGNYISKSCLDYVAISMSLSKSINDLAPKVRKSTSYKKKHLSISSTRQSREIVAKS